MSRIAFVADVHLGNHQRHGGPVHASLNRRCREGLDVLRGAVELADAEGCGAAYVLGDLFDYQRPEAQLLAEVQRVFGSASARWYVVAGNHDLTSTVRGDHALGPLGAVVHVVEEPWVTYSGVGYAEVALVPFRPGRPADEWLPFALGELAPGGGKVVGRAVGVHLGVSDASTAPWLRGSHDSVDVELLARLAAARGATRVFAGNWHDRRTWEVEVDGAVVRVLQLGALVPTGWDNPGVAGYGTVAVWDSVADDVRVHEVPGPRFLKLSGPGAAPSLVRAAVQAARAAGHRPYVEVTAAPDRAADVRAALEAFDVPGDVLRDVGEARAEARTAAASARSAETLDEALAGFVASAPLPEGLGAADGPEGDLYRAEVLAASRRYLAGARG